MHRKLHNTENEKALAAMLARLCARSDTALPEDIHEWYRAFRAKARRDAASPDAPSEPRPVLRLGCE